MSTTSPRFTVSSLPSPEVTNSFSLSDLSIRASRAVADRRSIRAYPKQPDKVKESAMARRSPGAWAIRESCRRLKSPFSERPILHQLAPRLPSSVERVGVHLRAGAEGDRPLHRLVRRPFPVPTSNSPGRGPAPSRNAGRCLSPRCSGGKRHVPRSEHRSRR